MKVELKEKIDGKWVPIEIQKLKGMSIIEYAVDCFVPMAARLETDGANFIMTNDKDVYTSVVKKGTICIMADEMEKLMMSTTVPKLVAETFPEAGVAEIHSV